MSFFLSCLSLFLVTVAVAHLTASKRTDCVSSFEKIPSRFDVCRKQVCIMFRLEKPFVIIDSRMNSTEQERPFRCRDRMNFYPKLRGIFFDALDAIPPLKDAWCVWGGPYCAFDDMIQFLNRTANSGTHLFIAGGLLFNLEYRMSKTAIPSVPFYHDEVVVIGPHRVREASLESAWKKVLEPFDRQVWIFLVVCTVSIAVLRILISAIFGPKRFLRHLFGEYDDETTPKTVRRFNRYCTNGLHLFFVINLLCYEIAVVNFAVQEVKKTPLEKLEPSKFIRTRNTTQSYLFDKYTENTTPETGLLVDSLDEVYDQIRNESNPYDFTVSYHLFNKYMFSTRPEICSSFQVYATEPNLPRLDGVWFFSSDIPKKLRKSINKSIMLLREEREMEKIIRKTVSPEEPKCGPSTRIGISVIVLPILVLPGVVFTFLILCMVGKLILRYCPCFRRFRAKKKDENESDSSFTEC